jgi:hypothetical protein
MMNAPAEIGESRARGPRLGAQWTAGDADEGDVSAVDGSGANA